jgi:hypothetical protein
MPRSNAGTIQPTQPQKRRKNTRKENLHLPPVQSQSLGEEDAM